jgi:hypothetical protein
VRRALELMGLVSLVIVVPMVSLIGENPNFLIAHGVDGWGLVLYVLALVLVPMLVVIGIDQLLRLLPETLEAWGRALLRGLLVGILAVQLLDGIISLGLPAAAVIGAVATVAATWCYLRFPVASALSRAAFLAAVVIVVVFLGFSPASALLETEPELVAVDPGGSSTSVVWLVFDQLPLSLLIDANGDIDERRYPNFAALADSSTWYTRATTVASNTALALPAALSGDLPDYESLPVVSQFPTNLFTLLAPTHRVRAYETFTQLCPDSVCLADQESDAEQPSIVEDSWVVMVRSSLPGDVADTLVPEFGTTWAGFGSLAAASMDVTIADEAVSLAELREKRHRGDDRERFEEFLSGLSDADGAALDYIHLEKPHEPLLFLPDGRTHGNCPCFITDDEGRWPAGAMVEHWMHRYLLQTMYVDRMLGEVMAEMRAAGTWDRSVLVVMSDHGASILPGTHNRVLGEENAVDLLPVPLFIREPGQAGRLDDRPVQILDVLPTVLDLLGMPPIAGIEGQSLVSGDPVDPTVDLADFQWQTWEGDLDPRRSRMIQRREALVPDPDDLYAFGPNGEMVGSEHGEVAGASGHTIALDAPAELPPGTSTLTQSHFAGTINGPDAPIDVAVTLDGLVVGVGTTFALEGSWRVALMLDPALIEGGGAVEVYEIRDRELYVIEPEG